MEVTFWIIIRGKLARGKTVVSNLPFSLLLCFVSTKDLELFLGGSGKSLFSFPVMEYILNFNKQ